MIHPDEARRRTVAAVAAEAERVVGLIEDAGAVDDDDAILLLAAIWRRLDRLETELIPVKEWRE